MQQSGSIVETPTLTASLTPSPNSIVTFAANSIESIPEEFTADFAMELVSMEFASRFTMEFQEAEDRRESVVRIVQNDR